jgi:hypothetical protein
VKKPDDSAKLKFRYRLHARGLTAVMVLAVLLTLAATLGLDEGWRFLCALPLMMGVAAGLFWLAGVAQARELGAVVLDAEGLRRVRGNGRIVATLRWKELRKIVLDRRRRMLLLEGPHANTIWCHGPASLGGVGVERFRALLDAIAERTSVPMGPTARRPRTGPAAETPPAANEMPGDAVVKSARPERHPAHA